MEFTSYAGVKQIAELKKCNNYNLYTHMKKISYLLSIMLIMSLFASCGGNKKQSEAVADTETAPAAPEYVVMDFPQADLSTYQADNDGYITIFNGKDFTGWRGYGREDIPSKWIIEDDAIKINGSGDGEAQGSDGGDIIFSHKFKNFELTIDWKVAKGSNSGIFYLAQEIQAKDPTTGEMRIEPIYISSPEAQVLDNENHIDAKAGVDGNRQSSSLYDMIPAKPQNAKPFGEWNTTKITVYKGTVFHAQNGETVLEYHLWTPQWTDMLQKSKFSQEKWPLAFELLNNCGGPNHEGYIGLQDHSDDVWFKNIKVKILD
jgi:hypothetical protein